MDTEGRVWQLEIWLSENGMGKPKPKTPPVDRTPRDVSWFKRGEECPH